MPAHATLSPQRAAKAAATRAWVMRCGSVRSSRGDDDVTDRHASVGHGHLLRAAPKPGATSSEARRRPRAVGPASMRLAECSVAAPRSPSDRFGRWPSACLPPRRGQGGCSATAIGRLARWDRPVASAKRTRPARPAPLHRSSACQRPDYSVALSGPIDISRPVGDRTLPKLNRQPSPSSSTKPVASPSRTRLSSRRKPSHDEQLQGNLKDEPRHRCAIARL